jgi:hypothetical protein
MSHMGKLTLASLVVVAVAAGATSLGNDTMTLTGANTEYDFEDNGTDEPATLNVVAVR